MGGLLCGSPLLIEIESSGGSSPVDYKGIVVLQWDLDNVIIDSFMWKLEDSKNIVTQISFQSKEYVE